MCLRLFLLLFSSGVSSYFLPPKEMSHLQNKTKYALIDEMLCLLEAEKEPMNEQFCKPLHIKKQSCAHYNIKIFIDELEKMPPHKCMKRVEKDLKRLEEKCAILQKSSSNEKRCLDMAETNFSQFKESLEEFLRWVNEKQYCNNTVGSESEFYLDGKCSCPDPWKYHKGLI